MTGLPQRWQKLLLVLGSAAVVSLFLAIIVRVNDYEQTLSAFDTRPMFPDLGENLDRIGKITIQSPDEEFDIVRGADGYWRLPSKADFWADTDYVRQLLLAFKDLELREQKSSLPDNHSRIGLVAPGEGGGGLRYTFASGDDGPVLADAIIGDRRTRAGSADLFYVRYPDEAQAYLAQGRIVIKKRDEEWLDLSIIEIDRSDVETVTIAPVDSASYSVARDDPDGDFSLAPVPDGRTVKSQYALNSVAYSLVTMNVEDVRKEVPPGGPMIGRFEYELFNGIRIAGEVFEGEEKYWVRFVLVSESRLEPGDPGIEAANAIVSRFKERAAGRVFGIPQFKKDQFTRALEELLEPEETGDTDAGTTGEADIDLGLENEALEMPDN